MPARKPIPEFRNAREELEFWDTHDPAEYVTGLADVTWSLGPKKRITLRMDPDLIADLKELAEELDMPYQTVARALLKRGMWLLQQTD